MQKYTRRYKTFWFTLYIYWLSCCKWGLNKYTIRDNVIDFFGIFAVSHDCIYDTDAQCACVMICHVVPSCFVKKH